MSLALVCLLCGIPASAGIIVRGTQGLTMTGADGIYYDNVSGLTMTGADSLLGVNGISAMHTDGLTMTGADGLTMTGADGVTYTGANTYTAAKADGLTMIGADGLTMTGADGLTTMGADGLTMTGADGLTMTGADAVHLDSAAKVIATRTDGTVFSGPTQGLTMTGADGLTMTGADGVVMTGVQGLTITGADGLNMTGAEAVQQTTGLLGFDPELALLLNKTIEEKTDDRSINAVVVYHQAVTDADIATLQRIGVRGGMRFRALPMVALSATPDQMIEISNLPTVRYFSGNRTLQWSADESRTQTGLVRIRPDADLKLRNNNIPVSGVGVNVAVLDTGLDSTHADLTGRVIKNVKLADAQGFGVVGFNPPVNVEGLPNTDAVNGHGTFVAGIIAGNSVRTGGKYSGYAPAARLVGLSAGDASLLHVLAGFDYLLQNNSSLNVRVVNCSFSADVVYNENDPVNVATRMLTERGVNVVFSAGNSGPGIHTLNPYAAAPWVIGVGATDEQGRLASFSARGDFGSRNYRPTLVAPGVGVVSLRLSGAAISITGATGLAGADSKQLTASELPYYTTASGTSFTAPQVAGTIALMLEVNPALTPAEVRDILQRTATPMPPYYQHEVGAGMLNAHAAVLEAAFPARRMGLFRATLARDQVSFVKEPSEKFYGTVSPGGAYDVSMRVPADAVLASAQIAWGPMLSTNDLGLAVYDPAGVRRSVSNTANLPGLIGKRERTLVSQPQQGVWRARVSNTLGLGTTQQSFMGILDVARAEYAPLADVPALDYGTTEYIRHALRTFTMLPVGKHFRPGYTVTRSELAAACVNGARVPQYMPPRPRFTDVSDTTTMNFIESAQAAPGGPLFPDAPPGGEFQPDERVSRLLAAVVLVRAAGLRAEADAKMNAPMTYADASLIPAEWRGYVVVAIEREMLSAGKWFNPDADFTRADLAQALAAISQKNMR
ncbi:MAG TPA: S8 family serine peptidase [Pyrinomonadaceae bacterium]|nr:S8 family serine peptidase [Pyrinomonadaceae bacterium]